MIKGKLLAPALVALLMGSCTHADRRGESAGGDRSLLGDPIDFGLGFYPEERAGDSPAWRWMGQEGIIRLRNSHRDMVLTIKGRFPLQVAKPSAIDVEFNHEPFDPIPATTRDAEARYVISAEKQGNAEWSRLLLTAHASFVPHALDPQSPDRRELAFSVVGLSWETAAVAAKP